MMKRYLTMLIALVAIAMGAKAATDYGFKIGETAITSDNYESVSQGEAWYYVPTENVLYLTDGAIYGYNRNSVIQIDGATNPSLKICVLGDCKLEGNVFYAIRFIGEGHHEIYGSGILRLCPDMLGSFGIYSEGNTCLTIKDVTMEIKTWEGIAIESQLCFSEITIDNSEISMKTGDGIAWRNKGTVTKVQFRRCYVKDGDFDYGYKGGIMSDGTFLSNATIKREVSNFNLTLNEPVAGGEVSNFCQVNGTGYVVTKCQWRKVGFGGDLQEGTKFQLGSSYLVWITVNAMDGERISRIEDCIATINGKTAEITYKNDDHITIRYAFPQLANTYYDVWVGGKQVNDYNQKDVLGDGGSVKYSKTLGFHSLTLENANITNTGNPDYEFTGYGRGIYTTMPNLTIRVKGDNTIESKGEGIYFSGNLSILGITDNQGTLSVKGSYGIRPKRVTEEKTLTIGGVDLTAEGTSGAGIGAMTAANGYYSCTMKVGSVQTVVKAKGTSVSLGNLKSLVFEDGLQIVQPSGAYFDGEDVRDGNGTRVVNQWVVIKYNPSIATGLEAIDNGELTIDSSLPLYNLQGQRVSYPVKGQIYIQNGRKVKF